MQSTKTLENESNYVTPYAWVQMIRDSILTPYANPDQVVVTQETLARFDELNSRARAHALSRGEHDALTYLHVYAIWNESLWRSRYDSFDDYCDDWDKEPLGVSKSSIKHKITDIKRLLAAGVTPDTIVRALGRIPMATRSLMEEAIENIDGRLAVSRKFYSQLPEGQNTDDYLSELTELGPIQANLAVDELVNRPAIFCNDAEYDPTTHRLLFRLISRSPAGILESELFIPNVPEWGVRALIKRLSR